MTRTATNGQEEQSQAGSHLPPSALTTVPQLQSNSAAGNANDQAVSGGWPIEQDSSVKRAASFLGRLLSGQIRSTKIQPDPDSTPSTDPTMRPAVRGQQMAAVEITTPRKTTSLNPPSQLKRPTKTTASYKKQHAPGDDLFEFPQDGPQQQDGEEPVDEEEPEEEAEPLKKRPKRHDTRSRSTPATGKGKAVGSKGEVSRADGQRARNWQKPQGSMSPTAPRRRGLRSQDPPKNDRNKTPATDSQPTKKSTRTRHQTPPREAKSNEQNTQPDPVVRKTPRDISRRNYTVQVIGAAAAGKEASESEYTGNFEESDESSEEGNRDLEGDEAQEVVDDEDEEIGEERSSAQASSGGHAEDARDVPRVQENGISRDEDDEVNRNARSHNTSEGQEERQTQDANSSDGENEEEYTQLPYTLHEQGTRWRTIVETADHIWKDREDVMGNLWVKSLMKKIRRTKEVFKEISKREEDSNSPQRLENRVNKCLNDLHAHLQSFPGKPLGKHKHEYEGPKRTQKKDDEEQEEYDRLRGIYCQVIPHLVFLLRSHLQCRWWDDHIEKADLEEVIRLQKAIIFFCEKAKDWNAIVKVNYEKKPKARLVERGIKIPLAIINAAFKLDVKARNDAEEVRRAKLAAAQRRKQQEEEDRRREEELEDEIERRHKEINKELARRKRKRERFEAMRSTSIPLRRREPEQYLQAWGFCSRPLDVDDSEGPVRGTQTPFFSQSRRRVEFEAAPVRPRNISQPQSDVPPEEDAWTEDEEMWLIEGLTQYKGMEHSVLWCESSVYSSIAGKDRFLKILGAYGGIGGGLQHRNLGDVHKKVSSLKKVLSTGADNGEEESAELLEVLGLV